MGLDQTLVAAGRVSNLVKTWDGSVPLVMIKPSDAALSIIIAITGACATYAFVRASVKLILSD